MVNFFKLKVPGSVPPTGYFGPGSEIPGLGQGGGFAQNLWAQSDPNTAAWAAYYQYYGQMAGMPTTGSASGAAPAAAAPATDPSKSAATAQAGQQAADYSQQWIEYYRSLGMHDQADAILKQIQQVRRVFINFYN